MAVKNYREVGIFDLLCAPLNPIGAFDAEQFKKDVLELLSEKSDEKFLAVDLSGLDFVYSDAYNAFIQFQEEMESRGGQFALLTSNKIIIDGLKKAGLDKRFQILASEEDMMSYSLQVQNPSEQPAVAEEDAAPVAAVASQNVSIQNEPTQSVSSQNAAGSLEETRIVPPTSRPTGSHRRFTKSFNAIPKEEDKQQKKGLDVPFDEEPSSAKTVIVVVLLLLIAVGATLAFFYIK
ncbi:STAS domain-containing protein [Fibrobacter sp. UWEL]|uniref:STAS domain-containing protein n=1 Tax=Fibrobacter sp. UWEL TaxID=1896209 RepID=UPI00090EEFE7|nr:STAS domain-containing protein [Fibrobacter sp. UWEL]SHL18712.1 anti-anti-sigma factor [Fibrobacter sp. UWEL]